MTDTQKLLEDYHFDILRDMTDLLGVEPRGTLKVSYIEALSQVLFTPQAIEKGLSQLGRRERETLAELQRIGGRALASRLRAHLIHEGVVEAGKPDPRYDRLFTIGPRSPEAQRDAFEPVIGRLMATGLVCGEEIVSSFFSNRTKVYYDNVRTVYIPAEVAGRLPEPPPKQALEVRIEQQIQVQEGSARAFQRDLYFYWSAAHTTPLSLTKEGRLYQRDLRLVNEALSFPAELDSRDELQVPRLLFLRLLLSDLGLLRTGESSVRGLDHPSFLGQEASGRVRQAYLHWRDGTFWNEVLSIPRITVMGAASRLEPVPKAITDARVTVLEHMADLHRTVLQGHDASVPTQQWVPVVRLLDILRLADYDFLFPRGYRPGSAEYYTYYGYTSFRSPYISYGNKLGWSISPRFEDEAEGWEVVEAGFVRAMLCEPLYWMGLVDLGFSEGRLVAYRLTPAGEWALGLGQELSVPQGEGRVIVQPNYEIVALDPISDLTLAKLDEFAERISAERAITYRLSRESVYRAQRNGWRAGRIIDTLTQLSDTPLPQNVLRTLEEWQKIHERIKIHRRGDMLQAHDGALLDRLMQDPRISSRFANRVDDVVAIVAARPGETEELIRNLQALGYPPARTRSADDKAHPSFTIDEEGQLHFSIPLPSIYVYEQIAPFTSKDEKGRYFLTRTAVEDATANGLTVDEILDRLRAYYTGPLPRRITLKVRAWGKYYGDVSLQTITLIQVKDKETLQELMGEPEFDGLLHPFAPDGKKALAVVAAENLDALHEVLAERNIEVEEGLA
jgi:hypothetical protein